MLAILQNLYCVITTHIAETAITVLAFVGAALLALAREQVRAGIYWALAPVTRLLSWNSKNTLFRASADDGLISELSLVDVFLRDAEGRSARYQKMSSYVATKEIGWY